MALPFDVKFFLIDMRFEHDRSERFHKQEYEVLHAMKLEEACVFARVGSFMHDLVGSLCKRS
jgi:hypothetical protein